ncbi:acyltransferase family protein [Massilia suwonensis]|uniref:Acyltransferase family protein n=1 Tax=Massilia suwonensis TaxID=648895 RepID=A0ABW0MQE6_9BURK
MQNVRLQHIDVWRFFAIFLVLLSHVVAHSHPWYRDAFPGLLWRLEPNGVVGVKIFFCISGFVICRGLMREDRTNGSISMRGFFIRRAYRILPPLGAFILAVAVLTAFGLYQTTGAQFSQAALFLCNIKPLGSCGWALGHTWSLAYEEQFYLIFPLLVASLGIIRQRQRLLSILAGMVVLFLLAILADHMSFLGFYLNNFIYLMAGCACALYWDELQPRLNRLPLWAWLLAAFSLVGLNAVGLPWAVRIYVYPIVFPILVCIAVFGTPIQRPSVQAVFLHPVLAYLGRMSYGIYLWQQLATEDYGFSSPATTLFLIGLSIVLAHYSFKYFELPLIELGARKSAAAQVPATPAAANQVDDDLEEDMPRSAG